ncbi:hypothetical protein AAHC03_0911 [Spirometra sp. Aus1]
MTKFPVKCLALHTNPPTRLAYLSPFASYLIPRDISYETAMTKPLQVSSKTVVIQPGSTILRIGLASDSRPTVLLSCIARRRKSTATCTHSSGFPGRKVAVNSTPLESIPEDLFAEAEKLQARALPREGFKFAHIPEDPAVNKKPDDNRTFFPFLHGLGQFENEDFIVNWPIQAGRFNPTQSPTSVVQDLEDMWSYALENFLGIPPKTFQLFSVILVIEDIFVRREVRQMVGMLLTNLKFARVVVQQASACATYGVGLPTACVVDIGSQKTSVACVDEGVSLPEVRVTLPIGFSDCLFTFLTFLEQCSSENPEVEKLLSGLDYNKWTSVRTVYDTFTTADKLLVEDLLSGKNTGDKGRAHPAVLDVPIASVREDAPHFTLPIPAVAVVASHLLPFFPGMFSSASDTSSIKPIYQVPSMDAPEPDDPFDDIYLAMTVKEKRRKVQGQLDQVSAKGDENVVDPKLSKIQKPTSFRSLADAILWSIGQASNLAAAAAASSVPQEAVVATANCATAAASNAPAGGRPSPQVSEERAGAGAELWRRMLGCILLVGGGVTGPGGQLIEQRLTRELCAAAAADQRWLQAGAPVAPVEVLLRPEGVANLAWEGARLMINADSISDLWFSAAEWQRYGSRVLRERAPFLW